MSQQLRTPFEKKSYVKNLMIIENKRELKRDYFMEKNDDDLSLDNNQATGEA